jgi:mono/diheme cytochrome c family protein
MCFRNVFRVPLMMLLGNTAFGQPAADPVHFYTNQVKPLLAAKCYACHTQTAMGGLRLDSRESFVKGGNSGPVTAPGPASNSLLMQVVTHTHAKIKMPPGGRLSDAEIAILREWVESGAHFEPQPSASVPAGKSDVASRRNFWAFQRPVKHVPPAVQNTGWVRTPIDAFILAKLEAKGLKPAPAADRRTFLRRVTLDLTGLPPTPAEYKAFRDDKSPDAFAKVVDRLLASKRYGERWGRHWLDVARYADADGLSLAPEPFANAWRYRDWVISAFNDDMPYDQFLKAQIAGDLLDKPGERRLTPGLGYLALGPWYFRIVEPPKARADELQDRIDVVARGMLGLTVACARCHDHKYDPIPTKDYYGIGGVLASTEYKEEPLTDPETVKKYQDAEKRIADVELQIKKLLDTERTSFGERMAKESGRYVLAAWGLKRNNKQLAENLDPKIVERWTRYLDKTHDHPFLGFWPDLVANGSQADAARAAESLQQTVDTVVREHREITLYNERVIEESKKSTDPYDIFCKGCTAETRALPRDKYVFRGDLFDAKRKTDGESRDAGVLFLDDEELLAYLSSEARGRLDGLKAELAAAKKALPEKYPFLHILTDAKEPRDMPLHRRGDPYNLGEPVPRHFLSVLGGDEPAPLASGSGRLDLANQIASPDNPLTARVMVNRIWHNHFGAGLVRSLSNFGAAGDRPSHPELLDYLAVQFIENGWSVKKIHREILLSSAYAMSSAASQQALAADPENRLLSRFNRRRVDVETLRDSMLFVSGNLQLDMGGPAAKWEKGFHKRTVYGEVSRFRPERFLTLFDFPDPSFHAEKRIPTNTSVQRLFFLNSEFMKDESSCLAARVRSAAGEDTTAQVREFYDVLFGRAPEPREIDAALQFVAKRPPDAALAEFAQVLLSSSEFSFID